jgi:heptosyltransferase II
MPHELVDQTVLLIQTAFLGDVILTTPLISALQEKLPGCSIDFLTIPNSQEIVETNPAIRRVIVFDKRNRDRGWKGLRRMGRLLAGNNYTVCITPHRSWRSAYLTRCTAAPVRVGFDTSAGSSAFTHVMKYRQDRHEIERNLSLLEPLHIRIEPLRPVIHPGPEDHKTAENHLAGFASASSGPLLAVAPGSIWATKRWPEEHFRSAIRALIGQGFRIALIGSREDAGLCNSIAAGLENCRVLAGELTIRQTYCLLKFCRGLLTNDSAPLHLGMAADIPVFAIFGATVPGFGFAPFGEKGYIFENSEVSCRPCGIHGGSRCPVKTFACMETIMPQQIVNKISTVISP